MLLKHYRLDHRCNLKWQRATCGSWATGCRPLTWSIVKFRCFQAGLVPTTAKVTPCELLQIYSKWECVPTPQCGYFQALIYHGNKRQQFTSCGVCWKQADAHAGKQRQRHWECSLERERQDWNNKDRTWPNLASAESVPRNTAAERFDISGLTEYALWPLQLKWIWPFQMPNCPIFQCFFFAQRWMAKFTPKCFCKSHFQGRTLLCLSVTLPLSLYRPILKIGNCLFGMTKFEELKKKLPIAKLSPLWYVFIWLFQ